MTNPAWAVMDGQWDVDEVADLGQAAYDPWNAPDDHSAQVAADMCVPQSWLRRSLKPRVTAKVTTPSAARTPANSASRRPPWHGPADGQGGRRSPCSPTASPCSSWARKSPTCDHFPLTRTPAPSTHKPPSFPRPPPPITPAFSPGLPLSWGWQRSQQRPARRLESSIRQDRPPHRRLHLRQQSKPLRRHHLRHGKPTAEFRLARPARRHDIQGNLQFLLARLSSGLRTRTNQRRPHRHNFFRPDSQPAVHRRCRA